MSFPRFLSRDECCALSTGYLVTVNLQHLYECIGNVALRRAIFADENARLCLDGRGALLIFEKLLRRKLPLATGNEILNARLNNADSARVLVIGTNSDVIDEARSRFAHIEFTHDWTVIPPLDEDGAAKMAESIVARYGTGFSIVAIALGVPKQEMLASALAHYFQASPILCIGGSFEMLVGRLVRAPYFVQRLGMEGVWRFFIQPNRARFLRLVRSYWHFLCLFFDSGKIEALIETSKYES